MSKLIQFTKNHWKKLTFASIPLIYGVNYVKTEYEVTRHMRSLCNEVKQYSVPNANNVLVVMNPVANNKKCEKLFKKYCEPVLHLAGYSVEVVKTKHIGHAKTIIESLQQLPDVLVIAGGDGTSSEVVTGLLRRNGEATCPILFLPLGEKNDTVFSSMQIEAKGKTELVKSLSKCLLALLQERVKLRSAVKYEVVGEDEEQENRKPIFGLHAFSWGILKEIDINKDKYWYFGSLRKHAAFIFTYLSNKINEKISAELVCTPPCAGCSKCITAVQNKSRNNFHRLFIPQSTNQQTKNAVKVDNKDCGIKKDYKINAMQIDITCNENSESFYELNTDIIENLPTQSSFLTNMKEQMNIQPSTSLKSRTVELRPIESNIETYYIDGESYDARSIKISFLPNSVKYFF